MGAGEPVDIGDQLVAHNIKHGPGGKTQRQAQEGKGYITRQRA